MAELKKKFMAKDKKKEPIKPNMNKTFGQFPKKQSKEHNTIEF